MKKTDRRSIKRPRRRLRKRKKKKKKLLKRRKTRKSKQRKSKNKSQRKTLLLRKNLIRKQMMPRPRTRTPKINLQNQQLMKLKSRPKLRKANNLFSKYKKTSKRSPGKLSLLRKESKR